MGSSDPSSLQSNLWLLLFSTYQASTSTSDAYIKLLLDLFEEIVAGAKLHKNHKKMEWETIVSHRRWGVAGLQLLASKMMDADEKGSSSSSSLTLTDMDPSTWLYSNFNTNMLYKGPIVSKKPESVIQNQVDTSLSSTAAGAPTALAAAPVAQVDEFGMSVAPAPSVDHSLDSYSTADIRYDPSFLLPFFHHFFSSYPLDSRRFVEMNGLSFIVQCMSHSTAEIRRMAYACMGKFQSIMEAANEALTAEKKAEKAKLDEMKKGIDAAAHKSDDKKSTSSSAHMEDSDSDDDIGGSKSKKIGSNGSAAPAEAKKDEKKEKTSKTWEAKKALYHDANRSRSAAAMDGGLIYAFKEFPQINLLLTALKNGITSKYQLLPGIVSCFLARALPILLRPDHALYKSLNRFLLARPLIDLTDIPLFYGYFHSTAPDWKFQRSFILRVLRDGFQQDALDNDLAHRRHLITILMNFVGNKGLSDKFTRIQSLQILEGGMNLSPSFLAELVRVHAFYPWVHGQVLSLRAGVGPMWLNLLPLLKLAERSLECIRGRIPSAPEADVQLEDEREVGRVEEEAEAEEAQEAADKKVRAEKEASKKSKKVKKDGSSSSDEEDSDAEMEDGEDLIAEKKSKQSDSKSTGSSFVKKQLSPQGEALKALRKRQRQRAQIARELTLLIEALSVKLHEYLWTERLTSVAAPSIPLTAAQLAAQQSSPLSSQVAVVDAVLSLMDAALKTAQKAHVASKKMTNRAQQLGEGRAGSAEAHASASSSTLDAFAPLAFRPLFLHSLLSITPSFLSQNFPFATQERIAHIVLQSSPSAAIIPSSSSSSSSSASSSSAVIKGLNNLNDTPDALSHYFHCLPALVSFVARPSTSPQLVSAFLIWMECFVASHPRVAASWFSPQFTNRALSQHLVGLFQSLSSAASSSHAGDSIRTLNRILARILGVGESSSGAEAAAHGKLVAAAIQANPLLSTAQRKAYAAAWAALTAHWALLSSSSVVASSPSFVWVNGFASLLLQEVWSMQLEHSLHGATAAATASAGNKQSTAFALIHSSSSSSSAAAGEAKKGDKAAQKAAAKSGCASWLTAQTQIVATLSAHTAAFAAQ